MARGRRGALEDVIVSFDDGVGDDQPHGASASVDVRRADGGILEDGVHVVERSGVLADGASKGGREAVLLGQELHE